MAITWEQAVTEYKEIYGDIVNSDDQDAKVQGWHNYTDALSVDGKITSKQADTWDVPDEFYK